MPAYAWLVHFPDDHLTDFGAHRSLPKTGDEIIAGWTVIDCKVSERRSTRDQVDQVDVWVTAKARRTKIRQRTDRP
jgi:hypothetical protein